MVSLSLALYVYVTIPLLSKKESRVNDYSIKSMENINDILKTKKYKANKKRVASREQELALKIIEFVGAKYGTYDYSSIFKKCHMNYYKSLSSFEYCKEVKKPYAKYFFWVFTH